MITKTKQKNRFEIEYIVLVSIVVIMLFNLIDLITTIRFIKLGYEEMNLLHKHIFKLGNIGFYISYLFNIFWITTILVTVDKISPKLYKFFDKIEYTNKQRNKLFITITILLCLIEVIVIIHNITI